MRPSDTQLVDCWLACGKSATEASTRLGISIDMTLRHLKRLGQDTSKAEQNAYRALNPGSGKTRWHKPLPTHPKGRIVLGKCQSATEE